MRRGLLGRDKKKGKKQEEGRIRPEKMRGGNQSREKQDREVRKQDEAAEDNETRELKRFVESGVGTACDQRKIICSYL